MYLRKLCIKILLVCLLTFYGASVHAKQPVDKDLNKQNSDSANTRLVLNIAGMEENKAVSAALELLMRDRLLSSKKVNLVPMNEVETAAIKGKAFGSNRQIFTRDIPYLCLKTDTDKAMLGWVEIYKEKIYLSLNTFDGISAINIDSAEVVGDISNIPGFIDKSLEAFARITKAQQKFTENAYPDTFDFIAFKELGESWLNLDGKNKTKALLGLISAKEHGVKLDHLKQLSANLLDNLKTNDNALLSDLLGEYQQALVAYSDIEPEKVNAEYHFRHAYLLLKQAQYKKLHIKLKKLEKIARKDQRLVELTGWNLYKTGHKNLAISKWRSITDEDYTDPEIYNLIAADALDRSVPMEAANACVKLANYYHNRKRYDLESVELFRALNYGGPAKLLDKIRLDQLNDVQKENLRKWIDSAKEQTPHHMLVKARFLLLENKNEEARDLLLQASATENEEVEFELGKYFLERELDIDRSISFLKMSRMVGIEKPRTSKALAEVYLKAKFCYKAVPLAASYVKKMNNNPRAFIEMSHVWVNCGSSEIALKNLKKLIKDNPDYTPAMAKLALLYDRLKDEKKKQQMLNRIKRIDKKLAASIFAPEKKEEKKVAEKKKPEKKAEPVKPSNRSKVKVQFPETEKLSRIIPAGLGRVGLINMGKLDSSLAPGIVSLLTSSSRLSVKPVENDFVNLIQADSEVVEIEDVANLIDLNEGSNPFRPDSFDKAIDQYKLDAVALFEVKESSDTTKNAVDVVFYTYVKGGKEILSSKAEIIFGADKLRIFNPYIVVIPVIILIIVLLVFLKRKKLGSGKLVVKIDFDRSFEDYYFAVRLSGKELSSPFELTKLMKQKWSGVKSETEQQIIKFFRSHSGSITVASNKIAGFDKVLAGDYHIYVAGIMVNIDNQKPLTSYEVHQQCKVEKDKTNEVKIKFDVTEAHVDIRITREAKTKKKITETVKGKIQEVTREVTHWEEVAGATVSINNDPVYGKTSIAGEPVSYTLPFGEYLISATYEDLGAIHKLVIENTEPRTIEMRLSAQISGENAEILSQSKGLSNPPADLQQGVLREADTEPATPPVGEQKLSPPSELPFDIDDGIGLDDSEFDLPASNQSESRIEPIELSDDLLSASGPVITHDTTNIVGDNTQIPIDTDDLFKAASQIPRGELAGINDRTVTESQKKEFKESALKMKKAERWDEAAELYLRAGEYDAASEMAQKSGNQTMNYKIYGVSYLKAAQFREAAEMFKYAEEPLLEAEALEGLRLFDEANKKRGIYWESLGDITRAMKSYEKAGAFDKIAMLHERMQNYQQAGQAYFKAREYEKAAECFINGNDIKSAAEAFEMNGEYEKAAEYFQKLGSNVKVFNLLEKSGKYCEAAEGYKKFGLLDEAVHACQQVLPSSEDYLKAALIMGKIFTEKNEVQLARSVYHKVVENADIIQSNIEKYYEFGVLIQEQGQTIEAFALFERLQTVKYNYADVTIRMQNLQEKIEQEHNEFGTAPPPGTIPPFPGYRTGAPNLASETPVPSAGQTPISSRYAFEQELGRGAMGIVYKAKDTALDRLVAYKTVSNAIKDNPASLKYFLSEAKSLAALNHSNIVTVFDVGQENSNYYITMEYVDGRSLADFIREKGRLSTRNCVVIATKICAGLEYAHTSNVVHRDIKPSNIMISNKGDVKIMDFGLAKIMTEAVQDKTIVRGTPLYMSPEQVEGIGVDHTSDIYSFGVTMFEMVTGTLPFTKGDIAYHHLHTDPPSPIRYNPSIPQALEKIIMKCLSKKKEERYQTASEIKRDLAPLRAALMKG